MLAGYKSRLRNMRANTTWKQRLEAGFTLLELLIVVAILGLVMAIATPQLMNVFGGAKQDAAKLQISALSQSLDLYRLDVGSYPTTSEGMQALLERPPSSTGWNGPYVKGANQLLDPWQRSFIYESPTANGASYALSSLGSDGVAGGAGEAQDIASGQ